MLRELAVQNLALIEDVRVELQPGFCAWSGETGAGKTLLLEALALLLGERGDTELLRTGADELRITGRFELERPGLRAEVRSVLEGLEDDQLIVSRRLTRAGRSYAYVNEQPISLSTLRKLGALLVDVHSQHESQSLLEPAYQLRLLDAYADLDERRQRYEQLAETVMHLRSAVQTLDAERQQRQRELALLRFEREELDSAGLLPGELAGLTRERERLVHVQALQVFAAAACGRLYDEDGSLVEALGKLQHEAEGWVHLDPALEEIAQRLASLCSETQDLAETLRTLAVRWEADPARREEVDERVRLLRRLETKYGKSIEDLIAYRGTLDEQESKLGRQEEDRSRLMEELAAAFHELAQVGMELRKQRQRAAKRLTTAAQRELADLGMAEAHLEPALEPLALGEDSMTSAVPAHGLEHLEFLLAANKGEPPRPLRKIASGGELSRTMLALKTVLAKQDQVGTLIFDEIDANVGGRLGDVLGEKLAALGRSHQVICVTHLPQVASYARHQWTIRKVRRGQRTVTAIDLLSEEARLEELASMLRGKAKSETTRQEVVAMLSAARQRW